MSTCEQELLRALASPIAAGIITVVADESRIARQLERAFPFAGSKIDWRLARAHFGTSETSHGSDADFRRFFSDRCRELGGDAKVFYVSDNSVDFALAASLFAFERHLDPLLALPCHHYFISTSFDWCIAYTMEDDIDFGRSAG